ncbi:MAG TPA: hypothetical protein DCL40_03045 [Coxiellaceae bacterium]|nr:hypothetical protein [Coxiellaceae bacterium]
MNNCPYSPLNDKPNSNELENNETLTLTTKDYTLLEKLKETFGSLNTRYAMTSCIFNIAAVLMVQASEKDNGLSEDTTENEVLATRLILLLATLWPLYHATHGWTEADHEEDNNTDIKKSTELSGTFKHKHPEYYFSASLMFTTLNLFNNQLIIENIKQEKEISSAVFYLILGLDFSSSVYVDIYLREIYLQVAEYATQENTICGAIQATITTIFDHLLDDPTILLRLWKALTGAIKQASFGNGGNNNKIVLLTTIADSFLFSFAYGLCNYLSKKRGRSEINYPDQMNIIPILSLVTAIALVVYWLPGEKNKLLTDHAYACTALIALLVESLTVSCMHPGSNQSTRTDEKPPSIFTSKKIERPDNEDKTDLLENRI